MAAPTSQSFSAAADRYAAALFDLALEAGAVDVIDADLTAFARLIAENADLAESLASPLVAAGDKANVIAAIADKAGLQELARKGLGLLAANGRAAQAQGFARAFAERAAAHRGGVRAVVTAAAALTPAQSNDLQTRLSAKFGKPVTIETDINPELLGGLTIRIGSRLFDASLASKLQSLKTLMRGA